MKATEFDGGRQRNTIAAPVTPSGMKGHSPTNDEKLRLTYLTGQSVDSTADPIEGVMEGLLPEDVAAAIAPAPPLYRDTV